MLEEKIRCDLNQSLKEKDHQRVAVLRFLLAEIRNFQIEKQRALTDEDIWEVIRRQIKLRKEAIEAYQKCKRDDLVKKEKEEMEILSKYLPQQLPPEKMKEIALCKMREIKAQGMRDFGRLMGVLMKEFRGQIEGSELARIVKEILAGE